MLAESYQRGGYLNARDATRVQKKNNPERSRTLRVFKVIVCILLMRSVILHVCNVYGDKEIEIPIAWYKAQLARSPRKTV